MAGKNERVYLEGVTINNPHIFRKRATIEGGAEKYRANFTMDPETKNGRKMIKRLEDAIEKAKDAVFDGRDVKIKEDRICLQDGNDVTNDDGDVYEGYADMMVLRATNNKRPKIVDLDGETPLTEDDDKIYGGCVVNCYVDIWATKDKKLGGNGVFATLMGVQFEEEGERFGGAGGLGEDAFTNRSKDDDDDRSSKKSKKSKRSGDDDDEDDDDDRSSKKSKKSKRSRDDDDEDDDDDRSSKKSKKSKRSRDDDDDEEDI